MSDEVGCEKCGLMGCSCKVDEAFDSICKKCRIDPCECAGKMVSTTIGDRKVCTVCRRAACICTSHVGTQHPRGDPHVEKAVPVRPYNNAYLGTLCNEALNFYYNRDPEGLQKWLRRVLQ